MIQYVAIYLPYKRVCISPKNGRGREYNQVSDESMARFYQLAETYCDELTVRDHGDGLSIWRNVYYRVLGGDGYVQV